MSIITTRGIDEEGKPVYFIEIEAPYTPNELSMYVSTVHDMFPDDFHPTVTTDLKILGDEKDADKS